MTARARFETWLNEQLANGRTRTEVAASIGLHPAQFPKILGGKGPGLKTAHAIEAGTAAWAGGPIRTEEWLAEEEETAAPSPSEAA